MAAIEKDLALLRLLLGSFTSGGCDIDECKLHYYGALRMVNPSGVVPKGPKLDFTARQGRAGSFQYAFVDLP